MNWTTTEETQFIDVELIVSIHLILPISFSSFLVTKSSIVSGLAHGITTLATHIPSTTSGEDSSGRENNEIVHHIITTSIIRITTLILSVQKVKGDFSNSLS